MSDITAKYVGVGVTILLVLFGFTAQWGVVSAKLDNVERRLEDIDFELRQFRKLYVDLEKRVSFIEGSKSK